MKHRGAYLLWQDVSGYIYETNVFSKLFSEVKIFFLDAWKILRKYFGGEGDIVHEILENI